MKIRTLISALAAAGVAVSVVGCGGGGSAAAPYVPVAPLAAQTATISIADPLGTPVVTITAQPDDVTLAGTATTDATTVSLTLDATNNSGRLLFNLKAVVDSISDSNATAAPVAASTGTIDTKAFAGFGLAAVDLDATASAVDAIVISDADGIVDDPLLVTVTLPTDHRMAVTAVDYDLMALNDLSGSQPSQTLVLSATGFDFNYDKTTSNDDGGIRDGVSSLDGRFMYFGYRNKPSIMKFDTVTQAMTEHELIAGGAAGIVGTVVGATMKVVQSSDGVYLYALVVEGAHAYNSGNQDGNALGVVVGTSVSYLYKVKASTMATVGSPIQLHSGPVADWPRPSDISLTSDNSEAAITLLSAAEGFVYYVNLSSMTITDTYDISTDTTDPISVAIDESSSTIYVGSRSGGVLSLTVADGAASVATSLNASTVHDLEIGPDGRLYYCSGNGGLYALDLTGPTQVELIAPATGISKISFASDGYLYAAQNSSPARFYVFDISSDTLLDTDGDTTDGVAGPAVSTQRLKGHTAVISAY